MSKLTYLILSVQISILIGVYTFVAVGNTSDIEVIPFGNGRVWCHNIQKYDTQHNDTQNIGSHCDIQMILFYCCVIMLCEGNMLSIIMLCVVIMHCYAECHYTECRYAECHYAD